MALTVIFFFFTILETRRGVFLAAAPERSLKCFHFLEQILPVHALLPGRSTICHQILFKTPQL